jgi:hypothetical protein
MAKLKPGTQLRSAVCDTKLMVIAAPDADVELTCGGAPLLAAGESPPSGGAPASDASDGTQLGKRYVNEAGDLELLCIHAGEGSLAVAGTPLTIKGAKPLPSSD